jgi:hypothetical protein
MASPALHPHEGQAFATLRDALDSRHRPASPDAFVQPDGTTLPTGLPAVDRVLAGGFPRGGIATLEGPVSSGRSALAARVLTAATARGGLGALVERRADPCGIFFPPSLAAAGVRLERLAIVRVDTPLEVVRAADILLRSAAFQAIVIPAVAFRAAGWSRLASHAHRAGALLLVVGTEIPGELGAFAALRADCVLERIDWVGAPGPFRALAGYELSVRVRKHKRASAGGEAHVTIR